MVECDHDVQSQAFAAEVMAMGACRKLSYLEGDV